LFVKLLDGRLIPAQTTGHAFTLVSDKTL
jgi:hypothetical protein